MKEMMLSEQFALFALNGLESMHLSVAKDAVLRGIAAARVLDTEFEKEEIENERFQKKVQEAVEYAKKIKKYERKELEVEYRNRLEEKCVLDQVPDLLGCDMYYSTAGVELKAYRSDENTYLRIREGIRAEVLEDGEISLETIVLLWLNRESGCMHDIFSVEEQKRVHQRILETAIKDILCKTIWEAEYHKVFEKITDKFLKTKSSLFKNPYLEGVNIVFPFIERRKAIFIDVVIFGTTVANRRIATMEYLSNMGHYVEEVKNGTETLLKIDNCYYRIIPGTRTCKVPIQGVNIVPVYWM